MRPSPTRVVRRGAAAAVIAAALAAAVPSAPVAAQEHGHHHAGEKVGSVAFPTSCAAAVQPRFEAGVAMLHSFWFEEALGAFQDVAAQDPGCAMAYWGQALTLLGNPMTRLSPPPDRLAAALAAAEKAGSLAAAATDRERGYIAAVLALYRGHEQADHLARMKRYEEAMRAVHERNPDDSEAAIFYALAVVANAPPTDLAFERQKHAASILNPLFRAQPDHPGLAHYIIHAFDAPQLAHLGLDAATRYADIAPAAPHALHMPTHIFTRLGHWDESIALNRRSARAEPDSNAAVHPMDYMVYAYLQKGQDAEAWRVVSRAKDLPDRFYSGILGYNFSAMQARYPLERGRWEEAAEVKVPAGAPPFVEAVARFARGIGAARSGRPQQARAEGAALAGLEQKLKGAGDAYWATIVGAQRLAVASWLAHAENRDADALRLAREAAELEETVEKHPVTPGPLLPARELEAELLLELGRAADALAAFEGTLEREPRRARALYGAARAAERAGDAARARRHYAELLEVMADADAAREEPRRAREFLSNT